MEKLKKIIIKFSSKLKYLYLCGAIIAGLNTLSRADYNFVLYLYMFYVWNFMENSSPNQKQDKIGCFYILIYSLFIDFIWTIYWGGKWDTVPTLFHGMTLFFSWIGILLKFFIIIFIGILESDNIKSSLKSSLNVKNNDNNNRNFQPFEEEEEQ